MLQHAVESPEPPCCYATVISPFGKGQCSNFLEAVNQCSPGAWAVWEEHARWQSALRNTNAPRRCPRSLSLSWHQIQIPLFGTSNPKEREAKIPLTPLHYPQRRRTANRGAGVTGGRDEQKLKRIHLCDPHLFRAPTPSLFRLKLPFVLIFSGWGATGGAILFGFTRGRRAPQRQSCSAMALPVPFVRLSLLLLVALPFCAAHPAPGFHAPREFQTPALDSGSCSPLLAWPRFPLFYIYLVRFREKCLLVSFHSVRLCADFVTSVCPLLFQLL